MKTASAGISMVFFLPEEFRSPTATEQPTAQLSLGSAAIIFEKPADKKYRHLRLLYDKGFINGKPITRMMVDTGAAINIMPYSLCRKIGRSDEDLIKTNLMLNDYKGDPSQARDVLNVELTVGSKMVNTSFFVIDSQGPYLALLGRDWIHANCCVPSTMHQCLIQWNGDEVEVVHADETCDISMAEAYFWASSEAECLTGHKDQDWDFVEVTKIGVSPVSATGISI